MIKAIICVDKQGAIGQNGDMPWGRSFPKDLAYFKKVTSSENWEVVVGFNTYKSLPFKDGKGFPNRNTLVVNDRTRINPVVTGIGESVYFINSDSLLKEFKLERDSFFLAGGASTYEQFWDFVDEVHITTIDKIYPEADTFFKPDLTNFEDTLQCTQVGNGEVAAEVRVWRRKQ